MTLHSQARRLDVAAGCPHARNAALLSRGAVTPVVMPGGVEGIAVLGHHALKTLLAHPDVAKDPRHFTALREGRVPDGWPLTTFATVPGMNTADGADHRRLRTLVGKAFTPRRVAALRPRIAAAVDRLLDELERAARTGDGVADLRAHFAMPLPVSVVCHLLGVDAAHAARLRHLSNQVVSTHLAPAQVRAANDGMAALLADLAAARAADPGDDLASALLVARDEDGDRLSPDELIGAMMLLVVAGHETTLDLITNAVRALCAHRGQLALVQAGDASWSDVVEETLRWDSPVSYFPFRYATRDLALEGAVIPAGAPVLAGYSAAGRDAAAHGPDADRFDVLRDDKRHLSFGHGAHFCLGAPLARLEAALALRALFTRFPDLDLAIREEDLERHPGFVGNSVRELPVRLEEAAMPRTS
ncbi:cytochrome P450 [Streptomyces sp. NPDC046985]|uniref:cytochrome P450 family protein n=1 Tax=Streptomyces sp. NPDC046985 TaxID=3155377 RepID=UPI0033CC71E7